MMKPGSVRMVCKHWEAGFCRQGNTCIFLHEHPVDDALMTVDNPAELSEAEREAIRFHNDHMKSALNKIKKKNSTGKLNHRDAGWQLVEKPTREDDFILHNEHMKQMKKNSTGKLNDRNAGWQLVQKPAKEDDFMLHNVHMKSMKKNSTGKFNYHDAGWQLVQKPTRKDDFILHNEHMKNMKKNSTGKLNDRNVGWQSVEKPAKEDDFIENFVDELVSGAEPQASYSEDKGPKRGAYFSDTNLPSEKRMRRMDATPIADKYPPQDRSGINTWGRSKRSYDSGYEDYNAYNEDQSEFQKASKLVSNIMYGRGDSETYHKTSREGPSVSQTSSVSRYDVTERSPHQSIQTQSNTIAERIEALRQQLSQGPVQELSQRPVQELSQRPVQELSQRPVQGQVGYSEYGSDVYKDANSPRTGGSDSRQIAQANRGNQDGGLAPALKYKKARTDEELGVTSPREIFYGNAVPSFIAGYMKKAGRNKREVLEVTKDYKLPANCVGLTPPKMNADAWNLLTKKAQTRDEMLQDLQRWIASGLIPLVQQIDFLGKGSQIGQDVFKFTNDALNVMAYACSILSVKRRLLMRNSLHSKFSLLCRRKQPVSEFLFGDTLSLDLQAIKVGTFTVSETEKKFMDPNDIDPYADDFKQMFFLCLGFPGVEVDASVSNIINMACANDGDVSDLREKYKVPANLKSLIPPKINPDIWNLVSRSGLELDYRLQDVHLSIAEGMVPLMMVMQSVHEKRYDESETLQDLSDAVLLLGNAMYQLNKVRMNAMRKSLPDHAQSSCGFFWPGAYYVSVETLSELSQD